MDVRTFDRAALLAALEPPRFRDGETEYVGRVLSTPEWWRFEERMQEAGALDGPAVLALIRTLTNEIFPPPPWWRRVWSRKKSVADLLLTLPIPQQIEVFKGFVAALARIHRTTPAPSPSSPTSAVPSPLPSDDPASPTRITAPSSDSPA